MYYNYTELSRKCYYGEKRHRTLTEAISFTSRVWVKLRDRLDQDDESDPHKTARLKRAYEKIDAILCGMECALEYD